MFNPYRKRSIACRPPPFPTASQMEHLRLDVQLRRTIGNLASALMISNLMASIELMQSWASPKLRQCQFPNSGVDPLVHRSPKFSELDDPCSVTPLREHGMLDSANRSSARIPVDVAVRQLCQLSGQDIAILLAIWPAFFILVAVLLTVRNRSISRGDELTKDASRIR